MVKSFKCLQSKTITGWLYAQMK